MGRHLAGELLDRGHEVNGLVRYVSYWMKSKDFSDVDLFFGDVRDPYSIREALKESRPDVIVHLAAQTSVAYSFEHPEEVYQVNFLGVVNTVKETTEVLPNLKKFIFAGSVEEYGNQKQFPINENAPLNAASPYGVSKIAAEHYLKFMNTAYNFPCVIFRSTNTYGRKHNYNFVIERAIRQMLENNEEIKMGDPRPVRDFLHIDDEVRVYIKAIETDKDIYGESINTGTNRGISIKELVTKLKILTGCDGKIKWFSAPERPCEIWKLVIDNTKINRLLDWKPSIDLDAGLERTVQWWREKVD